QRSYCTLQLVNDTGDELRGISRAHRHTADYPRGCLVILHVSLVVEERTRSVMFDMHNRGRFRKVEQQERSRQSWMPTLPVTDYLNRDVRELGHREHVPKLVDLDSTVTDHLIQGSLVNQCHQR